MVREVRQPSLITPQRPRVSSSATTTASRYPRPAPAVSSTIKVTKVPIVGTGKSRVVLGERQDNVPAVPPRAGSVRKDTVKEGRISLGSPSRSTPRATASSPVLEIVHQIIDFRPRASPLPPSPAIGCLHLNDDETMLLDMRPAEMSSVMTETDDSGDEEPAPMKPSGRLMTPADSQEVSAGSLHRFVQPPPSSQRHPISRLPTPPSSQAQSDQEHTVSQASSSRIRPRPSLTPPRWTSTAPSILLSASQDPSPNPRSKKTPRIESAASVPPPGRLRSPFGLQHRRDVSISPQIQGKGKSRSPPATLSVSAKLNRSVSQGVSSSSTSRTPLPPQTRSIPSTAPPATRRPRISGISRSATPKTVQSKPLSRHQTPLASARFRRSLTPSARKVLSGVRVGFLEKEIEASPGDDPLLLKGPEVDEVERQWPKVESWKAGLGLELGPLPMTAAMSSPRRSRSAPPVTAVPVPVDDKDLRLDHSGIQDDQYDPGQTWASDDDTDVEDTGDPRDDTFLHVLGRRIVHTQPLSPARHISETIAPPVRLDEPIGSRPRVDGGSSSQTPRSHDPDRISLMLEEARTRLGSTMKELAAESDDEPERSPEQSAAEADGADPAAYPGDHIADERSASLAPHAASYAFDEEHEGDATREAEDGEWDIAVAKSSNKCSASPGFKQIPKDASHSPSPETTHRSAQHEEKVDRSAEEGKESTGTPDAEKSQADHTGDISIEAESDDWSLSEPSGERSIVEAHQGQPGSLQDSEYMSDEKSDQSDGDQSSSEDEDHEEPLPAESGEKIVIRVINRGVVKIEDEQVAVCLGLPNELPVHASLRELPSTSLYPSLSTLPTLPTEPVLSQPLPSPSPPIALTSEHAQPRVQRYGNASAIEAMLGPRNSSSSSSVRPPSRLSQEVTTASTEDGPSRSRMSLRDELAFAIATERDNEGDESMRSVVEVSSLDPRAAARAAAILKLNHAYIEHGVLPPTPNPTSKPLPPDKPRRLQSRQFDSPHFDTLSSERKLNKDELLHEAELEIVATRRSRSRSQCRTESGWESEESEKMVLPGGWKSTPGKRKRREHRSPQASDEPSARRAEVNNGRPWGVKEWKRLEKLYKVERAAWMEKRMIQPLPAAGSPFLKARAVEEWDAENVVNRFLKDERVVGDSNGEWDREVVELRINALEGRVRKFGQTPTEEVQRSPKRIRANPASDSTTTAPPSTIRRMLRYVFPAFKTTAANDARTPNEPRIGRDDRVARPDNKLLTKLREAQKAEPEKTAMKQVLSKRVPSVTTLTLEVAHPSASTWTPALPILPSIPAQTPAHPAGRLVTAEIRPGPSLLARTRPATLLDPSNIPPPSSNSPSLTTSTPTPVTLPPPTPITRSLYPPLNPPLALRSNAIARLFPDDSPVSTTSTAKSTPPAPIAIPSRKVGKGSPSVQDLVRSFEDSGVLKGSLEKEKGGLRRCQSSAGLRDRL